MTEATDIDRLLDAAEDLFYERGYQAVGMDALRNASGLPLKRIYSLFKGKDAIAVAMLDRRDEQWNDSLVQWVDRETQPTSRVHALFDWLEDWLSNKGHRGCAWINAFGELGGTTPEVAEAVRRHKTRFHNYVDSLVAEAGGSQEASDAIYLLTEGCMVTAGITGNAEVASQAKVAAACLLASL